MYNNFCEYNVDARKSFYDPDLTPDERKKACGRLWKKLSLTEQQRYKDINFLALLPNPFGRGECEGPDGGTLEASQQKNKGNCLSGRLRLSSGAEGPSWI